MIPVKMHVARRVFKAVILNLFFIFYDVSVYATKMDFKSTTYNYWYLHRGLNAVL